jgi:integrase
LEEVPVNLAASCWAVTHLRAGVPLELVRRQLGHSTPVLTLKTYGAFIPTAEDRVKWEAMVQADTERRRQPKTGEL